MYGFVNSQSDTICTKHEMSVNSETLYSLQNYDKSLETNLGEGNCNSSRKSYHVCDHDMMHDYWKEEEWQKKKKTTQKIEEGI